MSVQVMPYEDAKTYHINSFDLTKTWPHADYPLTRVGRMTLNRNPENFFAKIEQATFSPGNTVPGIGLSPDKMLLGRAFAYNDAQRSGISTNFHQLPVSRPKLPVNTYLFDGQMASSTPATRRSLSPTAAAVAGPTKPARWPRDWEVDGDPGAQRLHAAQQWRRFRPAGHPGARRVNDAQRVKLVEQVSGSLLGGVREPVLSRAFQYYKKR